MARRFAEAGARTIHVVDLDGALAGKSENLSAIKAILREGGISIEVGGGIRTEDRIREYLDLGVSRCILGTVAVKDFAFTARMAEKYGEKNVVSAFVHKDEEQPHMHFAFIPVVPDRKWNEKHPDRQREKVSAKECVTKADLEQFHTEYQQRLDSCFGRDVFPVQNGETIKGAANVAEIKAARAKAAFDEQAAFYEGQLENARQSLSEAHQTLEAVKVEVDTLQAEKNALQDEIGGLRGILEGLREKIAELKDTAAAKLLRVQERLDRTLRRMPEQSSQDFKREWAKTKEITVEQAIKPKQKGRER